MAHIIQQFEAYKHQKHLLKDYMKHLLN